MAKIGITVFPGSNCDRDVSHILKSKLNANVDYIWYRENVKDFDAVIIPGGFTYGDRLRAGAIAAHSTIIDKIKEQVDSGIPVLGICNGFQILVESDMLPGALMLNNNLKFICKWIDTIVTNNKTPFTNLFKVNERVLIPIAHGEGKYIIDEHDYKVLKNNNQVTMKYGQENPNGSFQKIASICNPKGNVMGMMPHPERASDEITIPFKMSSNAILIFKSLLNYIK